MATFVRYSELPAPLKERIDRWRSIVRERGIGVVRIDDDSVWCSNGAAVVLTPVDGLLDGLGALAVFGLLLLGGVTAYAFSELPDYKWPMVGITALAAIASGITLARLSSRAMRAAANMDLGTLLLSDQLIVVSHGRYWRIPRSSIVGRDVEKVGTETVQRYPVVVHVVDGQRLTQRLAGFGNRPDAVAELDRWIESTPR